MAFLFQLTWAKKSADQIQTAVKLTGSNDLATSFYIDSVNAIDPKQTMGYSLSFMLGVEPKYASTCATALNVQSPLGTWFLFDKQGYFGTASAVSIDFSYNGNLKENDAIQLGGMELKVISAEGFPKKYVLSNGRSLFELSDGGHLLEINYDEARRFTDEDRKYWALVKCDDGVERFGIEYPFSVHLGTQNGKTTISLTADEQAGLTGLNGMWHEGRDAWLPFGILLAFPGHKEEETNQYKLEVAGRSSDGIGFAFKFSLLDPEIKFGELFYNKKQLYLQTNGVSEDMKNWAPVQGVSLDGPSENRGIMLSANYVNFNITETESRWDYADIALNREHGYILDLSVVNARGAQTEQVFTAKKPADLVYARNGMKLRIIDPQTVHGFLFDQSKNQFHWTSKNPFQPYTPWKYGGWELLGRTESQGVKILTNVHPTPSNEYAHVKMEIPYSPDRPYMEIFANNVRGQKIERVFAGLPPSGTLELEIDTRFWPNGVYVITSGYATYPPYNFCGIKGEAAKIVISR